MLIVTAFALTLTAHSCFWPNFPVVELQKMSAISLYRMHLTLPLIEMRLLSTLAYGLSSFGFLSNIHRVVGFNAAIEERGAYSYAYACMCRTIGASYSRKWCMAEAGEK